ncbi:MAG: sigma-70 family RNA polymerase sigma factor [Planctomycetota bacterium]
MNPCHDSDLRLVRACQDPDSDAFDAAFEALYGRYRDRVYSIAYRITGSATHAMDVMQESFCLLFRKIESFRSDARFSTWLFRLVVNCSIDHMRHERARGGGRAVELSQAEAPADPLHGPRERAESRELGDHVQRAIGRLSPKLRAVLVLRYLEGQSYEELSQTLDVSMGTVKSRLARAHLALEKQLRGTLEVFGIPEDADEDALDRSEGAA